MNKLTIFISALCISSFVSAYDTEIYGTAGNTNNNKVNPNVLFIVDTSGSMRGSVAIEEKVAFDPTHNYTNSSKVMDNPNYYTSWGWNISSFDSSSCSELITKFTKTDSGRTIEDHSISVNALQKRNDVLQSLQLAKSGDITCYPYEGEVGYKYTFYSPDYSNWVQSSNKVDITSTRMDVIKEVVTNLTNNLEDINLGLMRFNGSSGGRIDVPVADITSSGQDIRDTLANYQPEDSTPLTETLHEAALYFRGEAKEYSGSGNHTSPITAECQKNHIILFTDGEPSNDEGANAYATGNIADMDLTGVTPSLNKSCSGNGDCLDELSYWMKNSDHSDQIGDQTITTYTIGGFNLDAAADLLNRTAIHGGGKFYEADDASGISSVLTAIFLEILATDTTFTAPAVSVNAFNASEHKDELFYALFRPDDKTKWAGNLKKYKLSSDGVVMDASTISQVAVDDTTGYFKDTSIDYWNGTVIPDGKNVTKGGIANKLIPANRHIYTDYMNSGTIAMSDFSNSTNGATQASFAIPAITPADTAADTTTFENVRDWAKGIDVLDSDGDLSTTDSRKSIGDPLHSEPVIITYGGTAASPDSTIFFGTNEGFIHAIDTDSGAEEFAFIPKELHSIQNTYYENPAFNDKPYGMDGLISTWMYDINGNGVIYNPSGNLESEDVDGVPTPEHAYLYAGMRRGGNSYYGLDVTDKTDPTMLFKITGGTAGFEKLGETWSRMTVAKVKFNKKSKFVLFFTGGYDTNQDGNSTREDDAKGNAIYMVDATTGALLWTAGKSGEDLNISDMKNSMPASLSAIDITGDGHINYLFAADTAGRVFRIDINQANTNASTFATGGMIAQVGGDTAASNLRFYNKPNVALVKDKQYGDYLTISIGSGHRAHPLLTKTVKNRFYVIKDRHPYPYPLSVTPTYRSKTEATDNILAVAGGVKVVDSQKLYNATSLMTGGKAAYINDMPAIMNNGGGWFVDMNINGEKILAESTTFSSAVIFTSFSPSTGSLSSNCGADTGSARIYVLDQKTAMPAIDLDNDGDLDSDDHSQLLTHAGIAPRPVVIYRAGGGKTIAIGTETIDDDRFDDNDPDENCEDDNSCGDDIKKCEENSCNVTPVYWHQNDI